MEDFAASIGKKPIWRKDATSRYFSYTRKYSAGDRTCRAKRVVWYDDARSLQAKVGLVQRHRLRGIAIWALGNEGAGSWSRLDAVRPAADDALGPVPTGQRDDRQLEPPQGVEVVGDVRLAAGLSGRPHRPEPLGLGQVLLQHGDICTFGGGRLGERPVGVIAEVGQSQGGVDRRRPVTPQTGVGVEPVVAEEVMSVLRHEGDGADDVLEHLLGDEVVEVDPHPAGLDALAAGGDLALVLVGALDVDAEQPVAVGARRRSTRRAPGCRTGRSSSATTTLWCR